MNLSYKYLTIIDFKQRVEAIVDVFSEMKIELDREKELCRRSGIPEKSKLRKRC
ncbi:MAG: hypothetical protein JW870_07245 [Candidatus Delongbacteria bacterium]|nr:hypothetical protein [Candidatus Delongbacteria bacterium]